MRYGKAIKIARTAKSKSQRDLAIEAGLDPSYISLMEAGKRTPSLPVLEKISNALSIPVHLLILLGSENSDLRNISEAQAGSLGRLLVALLQEDEDDYKPENNTTLSTRFH